MWRFDYLWRRPTAHLCEAARLKGTLIDGEKNDKNVEKDEESQITGVRSRLLAAPGLIVNSAGQIISSSVNLATPAYRSVSYVAGTLGAVSSAAVSSIARTGHAALSNSSILAAPVYWFVPYVSGTLGMVSSAAISSVALAGEAVTKSGHVALNAYENEELWNNWLPVVITALRAVNKNTMTVLTEGTSIPITALDVGLLVFTGYVIVKEGIKLYTKYQNGEVTHQCIIKYMASLCVYINAAIPLKMAESIFKHVRNDDLNGDKANLSRQQEMRKLVTKNMKNGVELIANVSKWFKKTDNPNTWVADSLTVSGLSAIVMTIVNHIMNDKNVSKSLYELRNIDDWSVVFQFVCKVVDEYMSQ